MSEDGKRFTSLNWADALGDGCRVGDAPAFEEDQRGEATNWNDRASESTAGRDIGVSLTDVAGPNEIRIAPLQDSQDVFRAGDV